MTPHKRSSLRGRYREVWSAVYAASWRYYDFGENDKAEARACEEADRAVEELYAHEHPKGEVSR